MSTLSKIQELPSQLITPENFQPYGQVIYASKDGKIEVIDRGSSKYLQLLFQNL